MPRIPPKRPRVVYSPSALASGDGSRVIADGGVASGNHCTAIGRGCVLTGNFNTAHGDRCTLTGDRCSATGCHCVVTGTGASIGPCGVVYGEEPAFLGIPQGRQEVVFGVGPELSVGKINFKGVDRFERCEVKEGSLATAEATCMDYAWFDGKKAHVRVGNVTVHGRKGETLEVTFGDGCQWKKLLIGPQQTAGAGIQVMSGGTVAFKMDASSIEQATAGTDVRIGIVRMEGGSATFTVVDKGAMR